MVVILRWWSPFSRTDQIETVCYFPARFTRASRLLFGEKVYFLYHNSSCHLSTIPPKAPQTRPSMASTSTKPKCFGKMIGCWKLRAKTDDEPRFLVIGKIGENHWAAVCAHRGDNVRIISVRR